YYEGEASIIFYYAGHGLPDEKTKEGYLIPVDVNGSNIHNGIRLDDLYEQLSKFPTKKTIIILDACFSGGGRNEGLSASRGVKIIPKDNLVSGNLVVLTSSSGNQSSLPYNDKQHGIFTYFLLKKLKESSGDVSLFELSEYVKKQVQIKSIKVNSVLQDPTVIVSPLVSDYWKSWKLN
ncbi:caspase domain-containing protein, partial [Bacteroidota bacterium]